MFGQNGGFAADLNAAALNGTNGFRINGFAEDDRSGISVSGAGDVNGDGFDDLLIGASNAEGGGSLRGQSYVVFGQNGGFAADLNASALDGTNGFRINGLGDADQSGFSVSGAGDVNGDGFDDLLIGAQGRSGRQRSRAELRGVWPGPPDRRRAGPGLGAAGAGLPQRRHFPLQPVSPMATPSMAACAWRSPTSIRTASRTS